MGPRRSAVLTARELRSGRALPDDSGEPSRAGRLHAALQRRERIALHRERNEFPAPLFFAKPAPIRERWNQRFHRRWAKRSGESYAHRDEGGRALPLHHRARREQSSAALVRPRRRGGGRASVRRAWKNSAASLFTRAGAGCIRTIRGRDARAEKRSGRILRRAGAGVLERRTQTNPSPGTRRDALEQAILFLCCGGLVKRRSGPTGATSGAKHRT